MKGKRNAQEDPADNNTALHTDILTSDGLERYVLGTSGIFNSN